MKNWCIEKINQKELTSITASITKCSMNICLYFAHFIRVAKLQYLLLLITRLMILKSPFCADSGIDNKSFFSPSNRKCETEDVGHRCFHSICSNQLPSGYVAYRHHTPSLLYEKVKRQYIWQKLTEVNVF